VPNKWALTLEHQAQLLTVSMLTWQNTSRKALSKVMENSMALIRTQLLKLITTHFTELPELKFREILPKKFPPR
jgi:hypothetical protein